MQRKYNTSNNLDVKKTEAKKERKLNNERWNSLADPTLRGKVKHELRVASYELRVTSSDIRVTSSNLQVRRLKAGVK